jgi:diguanylate cyclase
VFLLPARPASVANAALVAGIAVVLHGQVDTLSWVRFVVSMASVGVSAHLFASRVEQQRHQLEQLATTDALSGAGNRRAFDAALADAHQLHARHPVPVALVLFDIDHFKRVNDVHGHGAGDACIAALAQAVRQRLRRTDRLFRYGGEEFVVIAQHTDLDQARVLAEGLRAAAAQTPVPGVPGLHVTVSLGVAGLVRSERAEDALGRADAALYEAKREGRNQVRVALPPPVAAV